MARKKAGSPLIRRNFSFPASFGSRFERLRLHLGATSDVEVVRIAFVELEAKYGFSPMLPVIDKKNKPPQK
ncbi:MAG: hypothetical protein AAB449_00590 [Patescibacteria group bacterium]